MFAATDADLTALAALERQWSGEPWSEDAFRTFQKNDAAHVFLLRDGATPVAYAAFTALLDYGELLTFGVALSHRRRGLGKALLSEVLAFVREKGVTDFTLEVRAANRAARALYESLGASALSTRKNFYSSPREDAVLYSFSKTEILRKETAL